MNWSFVGKSFVFRLGFAKVSDTKLYICLEAAVVP